MTEYVVKLGDIYMRSDKPISPEDRARAVRMLRLRKESPILALPGADVIVRVESDKD